MVLAVKNLHKSKSSPTQLAGTSSYLCYLLISCFTAKRTELCFKVAETFPIPTSLSGNSSKAHGAFLSYFDEQSHCVHSCKCSPLSSVAVINEELWEAIRKPALETKASQEESISSVSWEEFYFQLPQLCRKTQEVKRNSKKALPKVASCLKCRQALGWPSRSSRWYKSLLLGTVLRFFSCLTGISGCITTTHRIKDVSWTWKTWACHQTNKKVEELQNLFFIWHSISFL